MATGGGAPPYIIGCCHGNMGPGGGGGGAVLCAQCMGKVRSKVKSNYKTKWLLGSVIFTGNADHISGG